MNQIGNVTTGMAELKVGGKENCKSRTPASVCSEGTAHIFGTQSSDPSSTSRTTPGPESKSGRHGKGSETLISPGHSRADSASAQRTQTPTKSGPRESILRACLRCGEWIWYKCEACDRCGLDRYLDWNEQKCDFCRSPHHELVDCPDPKRPKACHICGHSHLQSECTVLKLKGQPGINPFVPQFTRSKFEKSRKSMWRAANSHLAEKPISGDKRKPSEEVKSGEKSVPNATVTTVTTNFVPISKNGKPNLKFYKYKIRLAIPGRSGQNVQDTKLVDGQRNVAKTASPKLRKHFQQLENCVDLITRRAIIVDLLHKAHRPDATFATDYNSVIISVGELYKRGLQSLDKDKLYIKQHKQVLMAETQTVIVKIELVGLVNIENLINHPRLRSSFEEFNPTQVADALKLIVSQDINNHFSGPKVNNQIMPASPSRGDLHQRIKQSENSDKLLLSINAVQDSLLLGVHSQMAGTRQPQQKYDEIARYVNKRFGQSHATKAMNAFGIEIGQTLMQVNGRTLEAPDLRANLKKITVPKFLPVISLQQPPDGKNSNGGLRPSELEKKGIVDLFEKFSQVGPDKIKCEYQVAKLPAADTSTKSCQNLIVLSLNEAIRKMKSRTAAIFIIVLPKYDPVVYSCIKYWGDCIKGVKTVCLLRKNLDGSDKKKIEKFVKSMTSKVFSKLGSFDHTIERRAGFRALTTNTMIVGAYLSRGSSSNYPSVAGVVATCDPSGVTYLASARLQIGKHKYIENLASMIEDQLLVWFKKNNQQLPTEILLFRGGVSDGQFGMIKYEEVGQLKRGFDAAIEVVDKLHRLPHIFKGKPNYVLKATVVSVVRHHHTRFYSVTESLDKNAQPEVHNAPAGLVIDSTVVNGENFNFYLQSHTTPIGTSKSAHYTVIDNGMGFSGPELQNLTYDLCFSESQVLYRKGNPASDRKGKNRVKDGMSICMPARYAENLCGRARCYIRPAIQEPDQKKITAHKLDPYIQAKQIWAQHGNLERQNPWDKNLDDTMFYL